MERIIRLSRIFTFLAVILFFGNCEEDRVMPGNCQVEPVQGPCYALIYKYYYDQEEGKCKEFLWGGCGGVVPFDSLEECEKCECDD